MFPRLLEKMQNLMSLHFYVLCIRIEDKSEMSYVVMLDVDFMERSCFPAGIHDRYLIDDREHLIPIRDMNRESLGMCQYVVEIRDSRCVVCEG